MPFIKIINQDKPCNGCTKCCEGFLSGYAYGMPFYEGKLCYFKGKKGCKIYSIRPHNPCVTFKCFWKESILVPEKFKPNIINCIMVERYRDGYFWIEIHKAGGDVPQEVIDWATDLVENDKVKNFRFINKNYKYQIITKNQDFRNYMKEKFPELFEDV
jgi:hypothetical protein